MPRKTAGPKRKRGADTPANSDEEHDHAAQPDEPPTPSTAPQKTKKPRAVPQTPPQHDEDIVDAEHSEDEDEGDPIQLSPSRPSSSAAAAPAQLASESPSRPGPGPGPAHTPVTPQRNVRFNAIRDSQQDTEDEADDASDADVVGGDADAPGNQNQKPPLGGGGGTAQAQAQGGKRTGKGINIPIPRASAHARGGKAGLTSERTPERKGGSGVTPHVKGMSFPTSPPTPHSPSSPSRELAHATPPIDPPHKPDFGSPGDAADAPGGKAEKDAAGDAASPTQEPARSETPTGAGTATTTAVVPPTPATVFGSRFASTAGAPSFGSIAGFGSSSTTTTTATTTASPAPAPSPFGTFGSSTASGGGFASFATAGSGGSLFGGGGGTSSSSFSAFSSFPTSTSGASQSSSFAKFSTPASASLGARSSLGGFGGGGGTFDEEEGGGAEGEETQPEWEADWTDPNAGEKRVVEEVVVSTGEEHDTTLFSARCKLFAMDDTAREWKERGTGTVKVNRSGETGRGRLVMRQDAVLRVLLNAPLFKGMAFHVENGRFVRFAAPEVQSGGLGEAGANGNGNANGANGSGEKVKLTNFLVKMSNPAVGSELVSKVEAFVK
ncbi:hypothetical protein M427DRAFT_155466 [Gonapodya prolifera JEL478]|uniref:RanBD1 domain-containing protein n=1 Tax=Gonapodya prolifera (strain JEL478) TaxID=1344416 RepID=A0A139AER8_GONPJ|nr:hypothetical protein M427DRAFT_155466 [Gonapodya prolifera JEL478]|eukprot:KXS15291.1 hypothetical protein M427DRAFT_155466 [Gonapodya prolifera JEL478]